LETRRKEIKIDCIPPRRQDAKALIMGKKREKKAHFCNKKTRFDEKSGKNEQKAKKRLVFV